ncbi:MAG: 23S rRNA (guanosine(2251)-2'-O)-methyltransferase RlmB [Desulfotignum sp.]|nr:23S rRNA (guanosine(2251)-2'-O)-methyltransferase RlmB [Desulfotignum sp.]
MGTPKQTTEILFGFHGVYEALKAGRRRFEALYISRGPSGRRGETLVSLAKDAGIPVTLTDARNLDDLSRGGVHQGIAARTSVFPVLYQKDLISRIRHRHTPYQVLVLDQIEDPQNLGALIRTALCTGVDYIVIPRDRSAMPGPGVCRASAGAMEHAQIFVVTNTAAALRALKEHRAWVAGLDARGGTLLHRADLTGDLALVVGGEHKGIRPGVIKVCDFVVSIPITGPVNSLNASVAGAMAMYEALRQRTINLKER